MVNKIAWSIKQINFGKSNFFPFVLQQYTRILLHLHIPVYTTLKHTRNRAQSRQIGRQINVEILSHRWNPDWVTALRKIIKSTR